MVKHKHRKHRKTKQKNTIFLWFSFEIEKTKNKTYTDYICYVLLITLFLMIYRNASRFSLHLSNQKLFVCAENNVSSLVFLTCWVPQARFLGPLVIFLKYSSLGLLIQQFRCISINNVMMIPSFIYR